MISEVDFPEKKHFIRLFGDNIYAVGGYVRDCLLGQPKDQGIDLLITHHPVDTIIKMLAPLGKVDLVGKSFGVIKFTIGGRTYDIALPRTDLPKDTETRGHKDFVIAADPELPLEDDLNRRDFRCNSIALRLADGKILDPLQGLEDIRNKTLRLTNPETFAEDPLRVLRAARFASVLGFSLDPAIYKVAKDIDVSGLSVERVNEELFRILLESPAPSVGLEELFVLGTLRQLFPPLYRLTLTIQDSIFHPEKDHYGHHTVWQHTKISVDQAKILAEGAGLDEPRKLALLLAALYHDAGKVVTTQWEFKQGRMVIITHGHDITGEKITEDTFNRFKIFSWRGYDLRQTVLALVKCHHRASELWQNRDVLTKKAFNRLNADMDGEIELLVLLDVADRAGRSETPVQGLDEQGRWLLDKFVELNVTKETLKPLIMGRDLIAKGISPGPEMGRILDRLYQMQIDSEFETKKDGLKLADQVIREFNKEKE
ncbi:MAG: HD domain-containing protein [Candidatus Aminicenantes bacterium]|nr:HD domain-containing protein [Candidatus Aminicenantes bacterium]